MNKTHQQIKFECIVIVASIDICVYFTSSSVKCIVLLVFVFKHSTVNTYIKRSGYYGNLGSLKAGTRHHGDYSVMGNSFPPTFPEDLLAHASQ